MNHFYITHFAGYVVLFSKETFHSDVQVNSVYIHDTRSRQQQVVKEGQSGWVLQAGFSRASFRRIPRNGKSYFAMMSLHINNQYAKKRGIGKNLLLAVRTVMFQKTGWHGGGRLQWGCMAATIRRSSTHQHHRGSLCQHVLTYSAWPHTVVVTRKCARRMGWRTRVYETTGIRERVADSYAWCLHNPPHAWHQAHRAATTKCGSTSSTSMRDW